MESIKFIFTLSERKIPTINKSIKSLRDCGIHSTIYIYAEPGEYNIVDDNFKLIIHKEKKGCFRNFDYAINQYYNSDYIFVFQDDYIFRDGLKEELDRILSEGKEFGYYQFILDRRSNPYVQEKGWNETRIGWGLIGVCLLIKNIKRFINHPFYKKHLLEYVPKRNQQIDACIGQVGKELNIPCYLPSYSYVAHLGESTIGHIDNNLGIFFKSKND